MEPPFLSPPKGVHEGGRGGVEKREWVVQEQNNGALFC